MTESLTYSAVRVVRTELRRCRLALRAMLTTAYIHVARGAFIGPSAPFGTLMSCPLIDGKFNIATYLRRYAC